MKKSTTKKSVVTKSATAKVAKGTKKTTKKKTTKKASTKKASTKKKTPSSSVKTSERVWKPSKLQVKIIAKLSKGKSLTRAQLSKSLGDVFVGCNTMGHVDSSKVHPNSLLGRKVVKLEQQDLDGKTVNLYTLTAAGKKFV